MERTRRPLMQKRTLVAAAILLFGTVGLGAAVAVAGQSVVTPVGAALCNNPAVPGHCAATGGTQVTAAPTPMEHTGGCHHHWW